jgi:hypothetical protein
MTTTIDTGYDRLIVLYPDSLDGSALLKVLDKKLNTAILATIDSHDLTLLGNAMVRASGYITPVPEAEEALPAWQVSGDWIKAGGTTLHVDYSVDRLDKEILELKAIREGIKQSKLEQAKAVELRKEAELAARRDELAREFSGEWEDDYSDLSGTEQRLVDRIIELETTK